jgi:hypothetical protein
LNAAQAPLATARSIHMGCLRQAATRDEISIAASASPYGVVGTFALMPGLVVRPPPVGVVCSFLRWRVVSDIVSGGHFFHLGMEFKARLRTSYHVRSTTCRGRRGGRRRDDCQRSDWRTGRFMP